MAALRPTRKEVEEYVSVYIYIYINYIYIYIYISISICVDGWGFVSVKQDSSTARASPAVVGQCYNLVVLGTGAL